MSYNTELLVMMRALEERDLVAQEKQTVHQVMSVAHAARQQVRPRFAHHTCTVLHLPQLCGRSPS